MVDYIKKKEMASVASVTLEADSPDDMKVHELDTVDGVIIDHILSDEECAQLITAAEQSGGFAYWDPDEVEERKSMRNADTLEFDDSTLCDAIYSRLLPCIRQTVTFTPEEEDLYEPDLEGEWMAVGLNTHLLLNRYPAGGHFAPHADGSTMIDFNRRSLYTVLIYLNTCADGGATQLLTSSAGDAWTLDAQQSRIAKPEAVVHAVAPNCGRAVMYYHQVLHAGQKVGRGCHKYCLRSDVMYVRKTPICTAPGS